jgi:hypothetical protein
MFSNSIKALALAALIPASLLAQVAEVKPGDTVVVSNNGTRQIGPRNHVEEWNWAPQANEPDG